MSGTPRDPDRPDDALPDDVRPDGDRPDAARPDAHEPDTTADADLVFTPYEVDEVDAPDGTDDAREPAGAERDAATSAPAPGAPSRPPTARPPAARAAAARRAALLGARVVTGAIGVAVAVAVVAAVSLLHPPTIGGAIPAMEVVPEPAALVRVCPGTVLRLGDDAGQNAGTPTPVGEADVVSSTEATEAESGGLDAGPGEPAVLRAPAESDAELAAAQSQSLDTRALLGLAAASCREPSSSSWLAAGDAGTGRTALITLSNPTDVDATVALRIWGEGGPIAAPGLTGIIVGARTQTVLPLAGFAQGVRSPVVEVESRGGQVVATLQQSTIRAVDPGGVEQTGDTSGPSTAQTIPGVTFTTLEQSARLIGREDYQDLGAVLRVLSPELDTTARISLVPESADAEGTTFEVPLGAGIVQDIPLQEIAAGSYTVRVEADAPVVAAARMSSSAALASDDPLEAPVTDFAWFAAADPLDDRTLVSVPDVAGAVLHLANDGDDDVTVRVAIDGAEPVERVVPAGGAVALPVRSGSDLVLDGTQGVRAALAVVGVGAIAAFVLDPPQPVSEPLVVHP